MRGYSLTLLGWLKPEYVFQPRVLANRVTARRAESQFMDVMLPWGVPIRVRPEESLGRAVRLLGIYDLAVSETLWRLTDSGETIVDVGANIGYMTAVAVGRLGTAGRVFCFEPHPTTFLELQHNVKRWEQLHPGVALSCFQMAVSDAGGRVMLTEPPGFETNRGAARIQVGVSGDKRTGVEVCARKLADVLRSATAIDIMKIDVEGHEPKVLCGADYFVTERRIRDVIFEEHSNYPTAATEYLEQCGYTVYRIHKGFFGPQILPAEARARRSRWEPSSFLATRAPERARRRLKAPGWAVLRPTHAGPLGAL